MKTILFAASFFLVSTVITADPITTPRPGPVSLKYKIECTGKPRVKNPPKALELKLTAVYNNKMTEPLPRGVIVKGLGLKRVLLKNGVVVPGSEVTFLIKKALLRPVRLTGATEELFAGSGRRAGVLALDELNKKGTWDELLSTFDESTGAEVREKTGYNVECKVELEPVKPMPQPPPLPKP